MGKYAKRRSQKHRKEPREIDVIELLRAGGGTFMTRYQNPSVQRKKNVRHPYWFIRPTVPVRDENGVPVRRQKEISLGRCSEMTRKQAERKKAEEMVKINSGKSVLLTMIPFGRMIDEYIEHRLLPERASSTRSMYTSYIEKYIRPAFGTKLMEAVTTKEIQTLVNNSSSLAWYAKADLRKTVSAIFAYAKDDGLWEKDNPARGVKIGRKIVVREPQIYTNIQYKAYLNAIADTRICKAEEARLIVRIANYTSFRNSEVLGLQVADFDADALKLTLRRRWHRGDIGQLKTAASTRIRLIPPGLAKQLAALCKGKAKDAFIFARENGLPPDDRDLQQHVFRPAAEKVGIYYPGFGMHSFRRMYVTRRQQVGATPIEAMKAAGHTSLSMTGLYTVLEEQREREQVQRMWDLMEEEPKPAKKRKPKPTPRKEPARPVAFAVGHFGRRLTR
jgi:integrase